jgi:tetratricopeptide (TPR) repeat protein
MIYCMVGFPIFSAMDVSFAEPVNISMGRYQLADQTINTPFRIAQVFSEVLRKTPPRAEETVKLSKKEKKKLVEQGVDQYKKGERAQAKKTLEQAKAVFPANYAVPYYLGLIYLEEGQRSAAIAEWQQYVLMDTKSENSLKIRKHLTLLLREEAKESAKQALANEASLLQGPADENTVAISAFKNLGSENLGPLGKGMAALLIHDLSQVPDLQVVERVKLQALLQEMNLGTSGLVDPKTAPKLGKLLKARHVTTGNLADIEEENMQIASALVDAEQMESINTQEAQGALKKFYDLEKEIACEIIEDLGRDCNKMPGAFGKIHTKSLAALTAFGVGLNYLDQENYDDAREAFQKALDEDPKFDLAEQALMDTPVAAMLLMGTSETISGLSASGFSSAAAGSAVVGGVGIGTTAAVVAAIAGGAAAAASGGGGSSGGSSSGDTGSDLPGGTGEVKVTLQWSDCADLDLWVTDPCGNKIYYGNQTATCNNYTGQLDVDANAACGECSPAPAENIYWETAPQGTYTVQVDVWSSCDVTSASSYTVTTIVDGARNTFTGSIVEGTDSVTTFTK